jgi:hypothetical protein
MVIPSEGARPQIITSPDKKSQIISQRRAYMDGFGSYTVEGVVKNISSESEINAEIKIDYYDIDRVRIDTEVDTVTIPKPGGTRAFYIPYSGLRRADIKYHELNLC